jgi:class 3 adenylate cyclase
LVNNGPEYIGEAPNLARDLLYVAPASGILVHSSVVRSLTVAQAKELKITKFNGKKKHRRVEDNELAELWEIPL